MRTPRGLRSRGRDSDPWGVISKNAALRASREPQERVDFETPQSLLWRGRTGEGATKLGRHRSAMMSSAFPAAAPRRRWLLLLPFALVVLLAAAWTGVWFYAAARAEAEIAVWREREQQAGRAQDCASHSIGGRPFSDEVAGGRGLFMPPAAKPVDADIAAILRGVNDISPKPWPARFREWQARDGQIEITKARLVQEDVIAVGTGVLKLTPRGGLDGDLKVTVVGIEKVLKMFDIERVMSEGQIGATFNALDRLMPGLGGVARPNAAPGLVAAPGPGP